MKTSAMLAQVLLELATVESLKQDVQVGPQRFQAMLTKPKNNICCRYGHIHSKKLLIYLISI